MTNSLFKTLIITLATIANTTVAYAASTDDAGYIARQRNDVRINEDPAHKGDIFSSQDMIVTGEKSFSMLKFRDNSSMFVKANSKVSISEYQYNKNDPKDSKVVVELTEGGLRALSGAIGKANPQAVEFRTPVGTIGIRGTDFIVSIVDGQLFMEVLDGAIMVENADGEPVLLQTGQVLVLGADGTLAAQGNQAKKIGKKSGAFTEFSKVSFSGDQDNSPYSWGPWTVTDIANPTSGGDASDGSGSTTALDETTIPNETGLGEVNFIEQNPVVLEGAIMIFHGEAGPETTQGDLQAQVVWHTDTDIDLYLITPGSGVVSYDQQSISLSGRSEAILDWDNSEGEIDYGEDTRFENIAVTGGVPDGFYQFFAEDCCSDSGNTTDVTLTVTGDGGTSGLRDTFTLTENSPTTTTDTTDIFAVDMVDGEAQSYHRGEMPADQYNYIAPFDSGGSQEVVEEISF